jgi:DNA-directed RNA polymerase subunit RPC12/RpoP/uncharacterized membrane protein
MAVCPKCGKRIDDKIYISVSEPGLKGIRCTCGYENIYKQRGYDEQQKRLSAENYKRRDKEYREHTTVETLSIRYEILLLCYAFLILCSSIYLLVIKIMNDSIGMGILWFICSLFIIVFVIVFMSRTASYPKLAKKGQIHWNRSRAVKLRIIGFVPGALMMVFNIRAGLNAGHFF